MSYLHPPPGNAPVVVVKDVGGYVDQYGRQTQAYYESNREVRLHECRSACTIALALPNVCVFPDSILKFHKAYNPITRQANEPVSAAMMAAYPAAVRERLGTLTRQYKVLTGSELIRLGIRDCNRPAQPRIMVARAIPTFSAPENPLSNAFGSVVAALTPQSALPTSATVKVASVRAERPDAASAETAPVTEAAVPTPPPRPAEIAGSTQGAKPGAPQAEEAKATPEAHEAGSGVTASAPDASADVAAPTPGQSPAPPSNWARPIGGSAPVLFSARFAPWPYRLARRS